MLEIHLPDSHFPFQMKGYLEIIKAIKKEFNPDKWIHTGDLTDEHALSKYPKSTRSKGAVEELIDSRKIIQKMSKIVPELIITVGNHDRRIISLAESVGINQIYMKELSTILQLPEGWTIVQNHISQGIMNVHGDELKSFKPDKYIQKYQRSVIVGHFHKGGGIYYYYHPVTNKMLFVMNASCMIDREAWVFNYDKDGEQTNGFSIVENGTPHWFPLRVKKSGIWDGKLT